MRGYLLKNVGWMDDARLMLSADVECGGSP